MWQALRAFCVVLATTLAVFALLNVFAAFWYPRDTRAVLHGHPVFDDTRRSVYEHIYGLPIAVVRDIVTESFMENAWIYEPYVQFRERPREGHFVNVSPDGFRLNGRTGRRTFDPTHPPAVFLLGGSTTFGYGVRDEDTIAAHLEPLLRRDHPRQPPVAVYNFGRGYYGSTQEFLLLKSLVQRGMVPTVAVFVDGINEHFSLCPTYSGNIAEVFKIIQHDPGARLREVIASLPITRLLGSPPRSQLATNAMRIHRALSGYAFECRCLEGTPCHTQILKTYVLNKQLIRTLAREFGFDVHFVLQPVGRYRNRFTTSPDGTTRTDHSAEWTYYESEALSGENDHSFADILEHYGGEAFVDIAHYTSEVNRLIAERLLPLVARALAKPTGATSAGGRLTDPGLVESETVVAVDLATAFSYFTDPTKLVRWMGQSARIHLVPGGDFHVLMKKDTLIRATIVEVDAPRRLVLAWQADGAPATDISRVEVWITPLSDGTLVRVVHRKLPSAVVAVYRAGWTHHLSRLSAVAAERTSDTKGSSTGKAR